VIRLLKWLFLGDVHLKITDYIIKFLLVVALLLIGLSTTGRACEILNLDTNKCELMSEQNLSVNSAWIEFY